MFSISTQALMAFCWGKGLFWFVCRWLSFEADVLAPPYLKIIKLPHPQHTNPSTYPRQPQLGLGPREDGVPQARLEVVFDLGAVEEGARAAALQLLAAVVDEEAARV